MAGGLGDVPPKTKRWGELPALATPPRVGPKAPANPQPTRVGKTGGWRGRSPLPGGLGDVPPNFSNKGRAANSCHPATSGTQNAGGPSASEGGQRGSRGAKPPWRGAVGGVPPRNQKRGRVAHISNPATSGTPECWRTLSPRERENGGPGGRSPHVECYATLRGLYWRASAMWWGRISCEPSRSAMVRASLSTR